MVVPKRTSLLDIVAEFLVADPAASLAEVAEAAGIGRTTLHKHYATRDVLLQAVAHRAIDLFHDAVACVPGDDDDGGLLALVEAMIPIGPQLAFLWRNPSFDRDCEIGNRWQAVEQAASTVLERARDRGLLRPDVTPAWLVSTLYSLVYSAAELVRAGLLAPREAPRLVVDTYMSGLSNPHGGRS